MIDQVRQLKASGKTNAEILEVLNAKTIERIDSTPKTALEIKDQLGSATAAGQAIQVMQAIASGVAPLPPGIPDAVRAVVGVELAQMSGAGLDLSNQGTNEFLRMAGLSAIADLGRWKVSPWEGDGNEGEMTAADLELVEKTIVVQECRDAMAAELQPVQAKSTSVNGWLDVLDTDTLTLAEVQAYCDELIASDEGKPIELANSER